MKSIQGFLLAAFVFAVAVILPQELLAMAQHSDSVSMLFSPDAILGMAGAGVVSLANLDGTSYQKSNPGGTRRLLVIGKRDFAKTWPVEANLVTGEVTAAPELKAGKSFAEYEFAPDTFSMDDASQGDPGFMSYKHSVGFMIAGFGKDIVSEMQKHLNAGCVIIAELNDGQFVVGGSSDNPFYLKKEFKGGAKGADKRGNTLKGEQDGFMWGLTPLAASVVTALALAPGEDDD
ncbi:hypothetical protein GCM10027347_17580 [Larkinella harenae]